MLNTIKFYLKKNNLSNSQTDNKDIIKISKTIQSNLDKNILLLFQKEVFSKIDVDNYSDTVSEDTEDYASFKSNSIYSESESEIESESESDDDIKLIKDIIHESNSKKKIGSNNNPSISYQYDISELINAIK